LTITGVLCRGAPVCLNVWINWLEYPSLPGLTVVERVESGYDLLVPETKPLDPLVWDTLLAVGSQACFTPLELAVEPRPLVKDAEDMELGFVKNKSVFCNK
jgi:hypothetical protein